MNSIRSVLLCAIVVVVAGCGNTGSTSLAVQPKPVTVAVTPNSTGNPCIGVQDPPASGASGVKSWSKPDQVIDPTHTYCAIIKTDKGRMVAQLYAKEAPQNVNSFVFLAQQGFYDNLTWHRVIQDFMAQTGDPEGTGGGGPGYAVPLEVVPTLNYDKPGVIGMARTNDPNSAGSQFFITFAPYPSLNQGYTIIGQLVEGLDVLGQVRLRDPGSDPNKGDPLVSIRVVDLVAAQ